MTLTIQSNESQWELIRDTFCKGCTSDEIKLFLHVCQRTGLDPAARQIYPVKRKDRKLNREVMSIQTGIDGYRLIAERTGKYSPGREPFYSYNENKKLDSSTAYIKKMTPDGTWHEVAATAYYCEYVQKTYDGQPTKFWADMPRNQLAKCAEALALRKAFPAELSGIYTKEEMQQSDVAPEDLPIAEVHEQKPENKKTIIEEQVTPEYIHQLNEILKKCSPEYNSNVNNFVKNQGFKFISELPVSAILKIENRAKTEMNEYASILAEINRLETISESEVE